MIFKRVCFWLCVDMFSFVNCDYFLGRKGEGAVSLVEWCVVVAGTMSKEGCVGLVASNACGYSW